jgi:hypothetical protein
MITPDGRPALPGRNFHPGDKLWIAATETGHSDRSGLQICTINPKSRSVDRLGPTVKRSEEISYADAMALTLDELAAKYFASASDHAKPGKAA